MGRYECHIHSFFFVTEEEEQKKTKKYRSRKPISYRISNRLVRLVRFVRSVLIFVCEKGEALETPDLAADLKMV